MGIMTIREFNANISRALAAAEAGEDIILTRNGKPAVRITRDGTRDAADRRMAAMARLKTLLDRGIDLGGRASYDERTGR